MTNGDRLFFKGNGMEEDSYRDFITGLGEEIRASSMDQKQLAAKARVSYTNLSKVLNFKAGCSPRWRKKVCDTLKTTEAAVAARGHREPVAPLAPPVPAVGEIGVGTSPAQILSGVADIIDKMRTAEEKLRFWKDIFEYVGVAICLLRDGNTLYQNRAHRRLCPSAVVGQNLCSTCCDAGSKEECGACMVEQTGRTGDSSTFHRQIHGTHYLIETNFITINSVEYQVVVCTKTDKWNQEGANNGQDEKEGESE